MKLIKPFDPSLSTTGTIDTSGVNVDEQLMLYNDSLYGLKLTFPDGSTGVIPPSWNKDFILPTIAMGTIRWDLYNQIVATGYPMSQVYGELHESGEHVSSVNAGMQRGFTLTGGAVVSGSTTSLINDNNPTGTVIIEVTVSGAPGTNISIKSDGTLSIAELIANVVTPFLQSFPGQATILKIGETSKTVEVLGALTVDGISTLSDTTINSSGSDVTINAPTGKTVFLKINGVNIVGIKDTGLVLQGAFNLDIGASGVFRFRNGVTFQAWGNFNGSGSGTYTHGFGSAPFAVIPIVSVAGSATQGYDTITSTQVHITLGAVLSFKATMWS